MRKTIRGIRKNPEALVAAVAGLAVGVLSVLLLAPKTSSQLNEARFLVNLYKFSVGAFNVGIAVYLYYGPAVYARGIGRRWLPKGEPPTRAVVAFFILGAGAIMTSLAIVRPGLAHVLFWQTVGFSLMFGLSVGYFVLVMERIGNAED